MSCEGLKRGCRGTCGSPPCWLLVFWVVKIDVYRKLPDAHPVERVHSLHGVCVCRVAYKAVALGVPDVVAHDAHVDDGAEGAEVAAQHLFVDTVVQVLDVHVGVLLWLPGR